uniref:Uncharacterized protein n=1 Tax=Anguilla anguilla TaxID=7936 RepID=A0A0E9TNQ5_ANGAN
MKTEFTKTNRTEQIKTNSAIVELKLIEHYEFK